jgi:hypothetical protein
MSTTPTDSRPPIPLPISTVVSGKTWHLFGVSFDTAEGEFGTYIYALSFEHASYIVEELKQTARLSGQLEGWEPA